MNFSVFDKNTHVLKVYRFSNIYCCKGIKKHQKGDQNSKFSELGKNVPIAYFLGAYFDYYSFEIFNIYDSEGT